MRPELSAAGDLVFDIERECRIEIDDLSFDLKMVVRNSAPVRFNLQDPTATLLSQRKYSKRTLATTLRRFPHAA